MCGFHTNLIDERTYTEGIGKLSTADGKAFADPEVLRRLTSSVSCALDEAAAALTRMRAENNHNAGQVDKYVFNYSNFHINLWYVHFQFVRFTFLQFECSVISAILNS